jgi:DNA-binding LacI/PurR family transcriptional regulator
LGLTLKNEWVLIPSADTPFQHERYGYDQFERLWQQTDRPEGLLVFPDSIARGVITRMLEKRVDVPGQLKLVIHKNESIELLCPLPATLLVLSERELARGLINQVQKQFRGEQCAPVLLPFPQEDHNANIPREINQPTNEGSQL